MESRLYKPLDTPSPWQFSRVPQAWTEGPGRNIVAGLVAGVVSLPLAMGLGALAMAPLGAAYLPYGVMAGLYSAAFMGLIAVLAGARGVAIYAPRSLVSFVIAAAVGGLLANGTWLPNDDPATVMSGLFLMMAMAGVLQVVFALARLPRLVKFIPTPVMAGFQNAAAITIILSQLHVVLGLVQRPEMSGWIGVLGEVAPWQVALGLVTLTLVFQGQHLSRKIPPLATGLIGGSLLYYTLDAVFGAAGLTAALGGVIGQIPVRIPDGRELAGIIAMTQLPGFMAALPALALGAASIAVVASLDVLISAKAVENLSGQRGNSTRELLCVGAANSLAPLFGGVAGSISLSATTANHRSGASNALSLLTHGVLFILVIVLAAPLMGLIPRVVVAALVLYAGIQLFDRWTLKLVGQIARGRAVNWGNIAIDLAVILLVTTVALRGQIALAVLLGVLIAILVFTVRMSRGMIRSARYGDVLHSRHTRAAADTEALMANGRQILLLELEGALFFASGEELDNRVDNAIREPVRYVVLDIARVTEVDSTGAQILIRTVQRMKAAGVQVLLCGQDAHSRTGHMLRDHGVTVELPLQRQFPDMDRALDWCENHLLETLRAPEGLDGEQPFALLDIARGMDAEQQAVLLTQLERSQYAAGATVFSQGAADDSLYIILRGAASVRMQLPAGDVRLMTFSAGTIFGEMALLDQGHRSATVTADEALTCYVLDRVRFEQISQAHPAIAIALLANLAREMSLRLRRTNLSLVEQ